MASLHTDDVPTSGELAAGLGELEISVQLYENRSLFLAWDHDEGLGVFVGTTNDADVSTVVDALRTALCDEASN
jgi:hypothetical protein